MASQELGVLVRCRWISLVIRRAFLAALIVAIQAVALREWEGSSAGVARETLLIGGWVALWKPPEMSGERLEWALFWLVAGLMLTIERRLTIDALTTLGSPEAVIRLTRQQAAGRFQATIRPGQSP